MSKLKLLTIVFLSFTSSACAATYTAVAAGGNWSANATWGGSGHPVAGDTAIINATMTGTVTVDADAACAILNLSGNGGTLAFGNFKITCTGNVTLGGTITAGTGGLVVTGTSQLTSNGITFPGYLTLSLNGTMTLVDDWTVAGDFTCLTTTLTLNRTDATHGNNLNLQKSMTITGAMQGTATVNLVGTGTWTGSGTNSFKNNLVINTSGTINIVTAVYAVNTLTYIAGTVSNGTSYILISGNCTIATGGMSWNKFIVGNSAVVLNEDLHCDTFTNIWTTRTSFYTLCAFSGAGDIYCNTMEFGMIGASNVNLTFTAGKNINVASALYLYCIPSITYTLKSATASSSINLNYTGTKANCQIYNMTFTDVNASGSASTLYNWCGGALLRTTGIVNVDPTTVAPRVNINGQSKFAGTAKF